MYLPKAFTLEDPAAIATLLRDHAFALLITAEEGTVQASHLPLRVRFDAEGRPVRVFGHLARPNPQCADIARAAASGGEVVAIFSGPHAYISPSHYRPGPSVPTWNYLAVELRGRLRLIEEPAAVLAELEALASDYEADRPAPWRVDAQDPAFLDRQLRGILAFELLDLTVSAKAKLSQNRSAEDHGGVVEGMRREAPDLAAWMEPAADPLR